MGDPSGRGVSFGGNTDGGTNGVNSSTVDEDNGITGS